MDLSLVPLLRCPACRGGLRADCHEPGGKGGCLSGRLVCKACAASYPIEGGALELLPGGAEALGAAQSRQREHFDDLARRDDDFSYDAFGELPFQVALRRLAFESWEPMVPPGSLVLDIGCANGISTFQIAGPGVRALGIDISAESVVQAAERAEREGTDRVSFAVADADALPLADGAVDCVLCFGSLHHVPDPARTIAEAARVLRDGGAFVAMENHATPLRPLFDLLMRLRPIWREEAGAEALITADQLREWTEHTDLQLESKPMMLVPPHLANLLGADAAERFLRSSEAALERFPRMRSWGGLIAITGRKTAESGATA